MGIVRFALRFPHTFYVLAALILFLVLPPSGQCRRIFSGDPYSGGDSHMAIHRPDHAGNGTARQHLQPVFHQRQRQRHQEHGSADPQRSVDPEDLLPARRQSGPRHRADRFRHEFHSGPDAAGIQPPIVVQFNASSVPVLQLSLNSDSLNEQQLYDFGIYRVRRNWRRFPASPCRHRLAANTGRSWWILTRTSFCRGG